MGEYAAARWEWAFAAPNPACRPGARSGRLWEQVHPSGAQALHRAGRQALGSSCSVSEMASARGGYPSPVPTSVGRYTPNSSPWCTTKGWVTPLPPSPPKAPRARKSKPEELEEVERGVLAGELVVSCGRGRGSARRRGQSARGRPPSRNVIESPLGPPPRKVPRFDGALDESRSADDHAAASALAMLCWSGAGGRSGHGARAFAPDSCADGHQILPPSPYL